MKSLTITACMLLLAVSVHADLRETYLNFMDDHIKMCINELGMTQADFDQLKTATVLSDAKKEGCLAACVLKKFNVVQGTAINYDNIRSLVDTINADTPDLAEKVKAAAIDCAQKYDGKFTDDCELGMHTLNCGIAALNV